MSITPQFSKIITSDEKCKKVENIKVEVKTDLKTEEIKKIINISAFSALGNVKVEDDYILTSGKVVFYICYEDENGKIKKREITDDFSHSFNENEAKNKKVSVSIKVEKTQGSTDGMYLSLLAVLSVNVCLQKSVEQDVVSGGENLVLDIKDVSIKRGCGLKKGALPIEEQFSLPYHIEEVLYQQAKPLVTSVQCGVGVIIVDGEVRISAILLQNPENFDIIKETKVLPFRAEIECEQAMPILSAKASATVKSFKTDLTVDSEKNHSIAKVSVILALEGEAFSIENVKIANDAFSIEDETAITFKEISLYDECDLRSAFTSTTLSFPLEEDDLPENLKAITGEKAEIISQSLDEDGANITATLCFVGYFVTSENKVYTRKYEVPVDLRFDFAIPTDSKIDAYLECDIDKFSCGDRSIEISAEFCINAYPITCQKISGIESIVATEKKEVEQSSISVYIPKAGETLWSLCKKLNQTPENLCLSNKELQFPLTGKERILIYRQK